MDTQKVQVVPSKRCKTFNGQPMLVADIGATEVHSVLGDNIDIARMIVEASNSPTHSPLRRGTRDYILRNEKKDCGPFTEEKTAGKLKTLLDRGELDDVFKKLGIDKGVVVEKVDDLLEIITDEAKDK